MATTPTPASKFNALDRLRHQRSLPAPWNDLFPDPPLWPLIGLRGPDGRVSRSYRTPCMKAWNSLHRYDTVELARNDTHWSAVVVDIDDVGSFGLALQDDLIPAPTLELTRKTSSHMHALWLLETPVHRYPHAGFKPLKLYADVTDMLTWQAGGDEGYGGILQYHPLHAGIDVHVNGHRWQLGELAEYATPEWRLFQRQKRMAKQFFSYGGRNCSLFMSTCKWAGRHENFGADILSWVRERNGLFGVPLPDGECRSIAKSVGKYQAEWMRKEGRADFRSKQRMRGLISGRNRRKKAEERDHNIALDTLREGLSVKAAAQAYGVSEPTIKRARAKNLGTIDMAKRARIQRAKSLRSEGLSVRDIAAQIGASTRTVSRLLLTGKLK